MANKKSQSSAKRTKIAPQKSNASSHSQADTRLGQTREFIEANATLQTAGIAIAGAGLLALVATPAGRNLLRVSTDAVMNYISAKTAGFNQADASNGQADLKQPSAQTSSKKSTGKQGRNQRDQARA